MRIVFAKKFAHVNPCILFWSDSDDTKRLQLVLDSDSAMPYPSRILKKTEVVKLIKFLQKELESMK